MLTVEWKGGLAFEAAPPSGIRFTMDATPEVGGEGRGPTPVEALLASVAACSAMDVISILLKKKQNVTSYHVQIEAQRAPEGDWPALFCPWSSATSFPAKRSTPSPVERAVEAQRHQVLHRDRDPPTMPERFRRSGGLRGGRWALGVGRWALGSLSLTPNAFRNAFSTATTPTRRSRRAGRARTRCWRGCRCADVGRARLRDGEVSRLEHDVLRRASPFLTYRT